MRLPRTAEYSVGLAALTYLVLLAMFLWSEFRYDFQSQRTWEYLRSNPEAFLGALVPSGAMLVAGLVAYTVTRAARNAPPRAAMMACIVPFIAFPLAAFVRSAGNAKEIETVLSISGLFLLIPCMFITAVWSTIYLSLREK